MQQLNLPEFDVRIDGDKIFCLVRKKWLVLTPEEWVRQHLLNLMINHLGYPKGLIRLEHGLNYFKNAKRSDIVVLRPDSGVFMLVECKAPTVKTDQKVINQVSEYNKVMQAEFIAITNGLKHFVWRYEEHHYTQLTTFPSYTK